MFRVYWEQVHLHITKFIIQTEVQHATTRQRWITPFLRSLYKETQKHLREPQVHDQEKPRLDVKGIHKMPDPGTADHTQPSVCPVTVSLFTVGQKAEKNKIHHSYM